MNMSDLSPLEESPYYVFKLRTGETIFGELVDVTDNMLHIRKPLNIRTIQTDNMTEQIVGTQWIPFIEESIVKLVSDHVYFHNKLSHAYVRFYGTVLLRSEIHELHGQANERMENGEPDYIVMTDVVTKMRDISDYMANKFDIEIPDIVYSAEEKLKGMRASILH